MVEFRPATANWDVGDTPETTKSPPPVLVRVTDCGLLVVPISWLPKSREDGETEAWGELPLGRLVPPFIVQPVAIKPMKMTRRAHARESTLNEAFPEADPVGVKPAGQAFKSLGLDRTRFPRAIVSLSMNWLPFWSRDSLVSRCVEKHLARRTDKGQVHIPVLQSSAGR